MWRESTAILLAICRALIAFHNFLQAYIQNGVLGAIVHFYVKSSILAHENCLWRDCRWKVNTYGANFNRKKMSKTSWFIVEPACEYTNKLRHLSRLFSKIYSENKFDIYISKM